MLGLAAGLPGVSAAPPSADASSSPLPIDETQERMLLQAAGEGFEVYRTPHFVVAFDTAAVTAKSLASRLEQTYESVTRFCESCGFPPRSLHRRLEVIFFESPEDYGRYARPFGFNDRGTYGFYSERSNRSAFYNVSNDPGLEEIHAGLQAARESVERLEELVKSVRSGSELIEVAYADGRRLRLTRSQAKDKVEETRRKIKSLDIRQQTYCDRINRTVVQHEAAHHILYNNGLHARFAANPKWLIEGLACMFETPPGSGGSGLSAINQARLKDFRDAVAGDGEQRTLTSAMYAAAVAEGRMVPIAELIGRGDLFNQRGESGSVRYAAAWALVHYLHRTQNKTLQAYLREIASRRPRTFASPEQELALFEKHFGPVDETMGARLSSYILSLPVRSQ